MISVYLPPQPPSSVRGDPSQQRLRGQTRRQGGGEGEGRGRGRAVDPGRGGQLQPLHQQVSLRQTLQISGSDLQDARTQKTLCSIRLSNSSDFSSSPPARYEVDDIDEEGKE